MKGIFIKINFMDMDDIVGVMEEYMKVNGKTIKWKDLEF